MRKQQAVWLAEHTSQTTLPSMSNAEPASGVVQFLDYLERARAVLGSRAVDIGAGKGRNSVYMAEKGLHVTALEYIEPATIAINQLARSHKVSDAVHCALTEIDKPWPYDDATFDIAVDSFSSIDIETLDGREICRDEMYRTLKPSGYALVTVCSADDEWERELIAEHPGPEPNSTIWPQNGKFQKDYDEAELRDFYGQFEIKALKTVKKPAFKLGRAGEATDFWLVLRKPR